jgi:hypothetical protein
MRYAAFVEQLIDHEFADHIIAYKNMRCHRHLQLLFVQLMYILT